MKTYADPKHWPERYPGSNKFTDVILLDLKFCLEEQLRAVCGPVPADDAEAGGVQVRLTYQETGMATPSEKV